MTTVPVVTLSSCRPADGTTLSAILPGVTWVMTAKTLGGTCTQTANGGAAIVVVNHAPTNTATDIVHAFAKALPPVPGHKALPDLGLSGASAGEYLVAGGATSYLLEIATPTTLIAVQATVPDAQAGSATPAQVAAKILTWAVAQKP